MSKRKSTRKRSSSSASKKGAAKTRAQKKAKTKRKSTPSASATAKGKAVVKKSVTGTKKKKTAKKSSPAKKVAKKKAVKKKAVKKKATPKKTAAPKKVTKKKAATKKEATPKKVAKKKTPTKKKAARKSTSGKKTRRTAPPVNPEPEEPGLPLKEVRARLGLVSPQIASLAWLEGIYLYGAELLATPRLEKVDFIVVHKGIRSTARLRAAETELRQLIGAVLPIDFEVKLTGTLQIGRLLDEGNPAAQALLGYSEPVFARSA